MRSVPSWKLSSAQHGRAGAAAPPRHDGLNAHLEPRSRRSCRWRCVTRRLDHCEGLDVKISPASPALVIIAPTPPVITTGRSRAAAGRSVHEEHRSEKSHLRRQPHLTGLLEIATRSNEQSKIRG
eukprot:scaffold87602_cov54-Phaeocystis_antarctica.AAC.2